MIHTLIFHIKIVLNIEQTLLVLKRLSLFPTSENYFLYAYFGNGNYTSIDNRHEDGTLLNSF